MVRRGVWNEFQTTDAEYFRAILVELPNWICLNTSEKFKLIPRSASLFWGLGSTGYPLQVPSTIGTQLPAP